MTNATPLAAGEPSLILSQTSVYALKAVLRLAPLEDGDLLRVEDIADALDVPRNYLSKILHALVRGGLLHSTRGPGGGFRLAVPPERLSLYDVVRHFDDLSEQRSCLLGQPQCTDVNPCAAHARWKETSKRVQAFFMDTSVADLSG